MAGDGTIEGVKKAATVGADKKAKLYEVIKALSAMRLCKEDNMPDAILCRRKVADSEQPADSDIPFLPAMPKTQNDKVVSEVAMDVPADIRGDPCLFQGSIGSAYN